MQVYFFSLQTVYISTAQPQYLEVLRSRHFFSCCQRKNLPKQIQLSFSTYFFKIYLNFLKRKHRKTSWLFFCRAIGAFLIHPNFDITIQIKWTKASCLHILVLTWSWFSEWEITLILNIVNKIFKMDFFLISFDIFA